MLLRAPCVAVLVGGGTQNSIPYLSAVCVCGKMILSACWFAVWSSTSCNTRVKANELLPVKSGFQRSLHRRRACGNYNKSVQVWQNPPPDLFVSFPGGVPFVVNPLV